MEYDTLINIALSFNEWINDISKKYNLSNEDVQELIKNLLS